METMLQVLIYSVFAGVGSMRVSPGGSAFQTFSKVATVGTVAGLLMTSKVAWSRTTMGWVEPVASRSMVKA